MIVSWGTPTGRPLPVEEARSIAPPVAPEADAIQSHQPAQALEGITATQVSGRSVAGRAEDTQATRHARQPDDIHKLLDRLNHELAPSRAVHFDPGAPVGQIWLNVIDQRTGEVIERIPPERVRELMHSGTTSPAHAGLAVDARA